MRPSLAVSLLALALSVLALVLVVLSPAARGPGEAAPQLPAASGADDGLLARLDALAAENGELRQRLATLERRPLPVQRVPVMDDFATLDDFEGFREEIRTALGSLVVPSAGSLEESDAFKEQVASTLSEIRKEEAVENAKAGLEKRAEQLDETMPKIEEWLELDPYQSTEMRSAILRQYEREAELVRRWEEGVDTEILGREKAGGRETFRNELAVFLTPEQLETFWNRAGKGL